MKRQVFGCWRRRQHENKRPSLAVETRAARLDDRARPPSFRLVPAAAVLARRLQTSLLPRRRDSL